MSEPLDYESKVTPRRSALPWVAKIVGAVALVALLISIFLPSLHRRSYEHPAWMRCTSNLKQIGQAMLLYANDYHDATAPDFVALWQTQDLVGEVFVCNSTDDVKSAATQPAEQRADFAAGGHCSYVYVGSPGAYSKIGADDVVAFEPPGHHDDSAAVLFGDGRTERVDEATARAILRQYDNAVRPIRLPGR